MRNRSQEPLVGHQVEVQDACFGDPHDNDNGLDEGKSAKGVGGVWNRVRVFLLIVIALVFVSAGFVGGGKIAQVFEDDDKSVPEVVVNKNSHGLELEDDDDEQSGEDFDYAVLLHNYYKENNPERLGDVPMILDRYAGKELELFNKLEQKYGKPVIPSKSTSDLTPGEEEEPGGEVFFKDIPDPRSKVVQVKGKEKLTVKVEVTDENQIEEEEEEEEDSSFVDDAHADDIPDKSFDLQEETEMLNPSTVSSRGKVKVIVIAFPGTGVEHVYNYFKQGVRYNVPAMDEVSALLLQAMQQQSGTPEFNKFDNFDGIVDDSVAMFYEELLATYPSAKVVVVVKDVDEWFENWKTLAITSKGNPSFLMRQPIYDALLGSSAPVEALWKVKYRNFYENVLQNVPNSRRKLLSVSGGDFNGKSVWDWLSVFLKEDQAASWAKPQPTQVSTGLGLLKAPNQLGRLHHSKSDVGVSGNGHLKVLGAGLDGTGGDALSSALKRLGFSVATDLAEMPSSACYECKKVGHNLRDVLIGQSANSGFGYKGIFHGVDAVVGAAATPFLKDIFDANPDLKVIVTVRRLDSWWRTMKCKYEHAVHTTSRRRSSHDYGSSLRATYNTINYGSSIPMEYLYKKRYTDYLSLLQSLPHDRLLILDVSRLGRSGDAWRQLCQFLRVSKCSAHLLRGDTRFPSMSNC